VLVLELDGPGPPRLVSQEGVEVTGPGWTAPQGRELGASHHARHDPAGWPEDAGRGAGEPGATGEEVRLQSVFGLAVAQHGGRVLGIGPAADKLGDEGPQGAEIGRTDGPRLGADDVPPGVPGLAGLGGVARRQRQRGALGADAADLEAVEAHLPRLA